MNRPAFSFCICPDSHLLRTRLHTLLAAHPPVSGTGGWQRFVYWGDEGLPPSFWEHLTLQGLFASPKALVIRNAQLLPADTLGKQLSPALMPLVPKAGGPLPSPLVWPLVCLEVAFEKGKAKIPAHWQRLPFWQAAEQRGWLDEQPALSGKTLNAFIRAQAQQLGLRLRPGELAKLEQALPPDAALISAELAKLALCANAQGALPEDATEIVSQTHELGIFELMRIVQQNSDAPAAWRKILEDRLSGENLVFAFIAILLREARILWQTQAGVPPYLPGQIAMQKKLAASALGFAGIARLWELALIAEKGIKSGERSPDQAFELLTADLFLLFSGTRRPG